MGNFLRKILEFISTSSHSRTVSVIVILIIAAAIPLTVIVSQKQQEIRQQASSCSGLTTGFTCRCPSGYACVQMGPVYQCCASPTSTTPTQTPQGCFGMIGGGLICLTPILTPTSTPPSYATPTPQGCFGMIGGGIICPPTGYPTLTPTTPPAATLTPTRTPTSAPTPTPTTPPGVTATPTPTTGTTPTIPPGNTQLRLTLGLDGLGTTGDNESPENSSGSNKDPLHKTRNVTVEVFDLNFNPVVNKSGTVDYGNGRFGGTIDLGNLPNGNYNIKVKSDGYLRRLAPVNIQTGGNSQNLLSANLVTGDINGDNAINIIDYNILLSCSVFSTDNHGACDQNPDYKTFSDLDDNGVIDQIDYNLFIRELSVQKGN